MRRFPLTILLLAAAIPVAPASAEEPPVLPTYVVSVARAPQELTTLPITVRVFGSDKLAEAPTLDTALRADPAFSLFRRTSSVSANPTAQGVSLRGIGPSGASRTAVLLDGLPLNDPFGGWITWGQIPRLALAGAEIAHGGGSGVWGNAALGGTVAIATAPFDAPGGSAAAEGGADGLWRVELADTRVLGDDALRINARAEGQTGFHPLSTRDRGSIDRPLSHQHRLAQLGWNRRLAPETDLRLTARAFTEDRGNGTVLQKNHTSLAHLAIALEGREGGRPLWQAAAWAQRGNYTSLFTAVAADRMQETPANDQFAVPSTSAGAQATRIFRHGRATTVAGIDGRQVEGETREDYLYADGGFTRRRRAGGAQCTIGVFAHHDRPIGDRWHASATLRADRWSDRDGHTRETSLTTGSLLRDDRHAGRNGIMLSPRLGVSGQLLQGTAVRASAYRAFRQPTLNELHRPFRVGATSTLANPALALESLDGLDLIVEQQLGPARLSVGSYWNVLEDGVANVTVSSGPSGITRRRQNIEEIRVRGLETALEWSAARAFELRAAVVIMDSEVVEARAQPGLVGRRLAQVPDYVATVAAEWRVLPQTRIGASLRACGRQYEDDENGLPLAEATTLDLRIDQRLSGALTAFVEVQNLLDHRVQTGRPSSGLIAYDQPRAWRAGARLAW